MQHRKKQQIILMALLVTTAIGLNCAAQQATSSIRVNKSFITVFGPNEQGMALVEGIAGAIQSTSQANARIVNLDTTEQVAIQINENGGFTVEISAEVGQRIRIIARNAERRQSYGTFTIPAYQRPAAQPSTASQPQAQAAATAVEQPREQAQADGTTAIDCPGRLAVSIVVFDTFTGEALASETTTGLARSSIATNQDRGQIANHILQRCISVAQTQLRPLSAAEAETIIEEAQTEQTVQDPNEQ